MRPARQMPEGNEDGSVGEVHPLRQLDEAPRSEPPAPPQVDATDVEPEGEAPEEGEHRFYGWAVERLQRRFRAFAIATTLVSLLLIGALVTLGVVIMQSRDSARDAEIARSAATAARSQATEASTTAAGLREDIAASESEIAALEGRVGELQSELDDTRAASTKKSRCLLKLLKQSDQTLRRLVSGDLGATAYLNDPQSFRCPV